MPTTAGFRAPGRELVLAAPPQLIELAPLAFKLELVLINLPILFVGGIFPALELIAHQRTGAETERRTDRRACTRMAHRRADNTAGGGAAERTDARALFARRQRTTGATRQESGGEDQT